MRKKLRQEFCQPFLHTPCRLTLYYSIEKYSKKLTRSRLQQRPVSIWKIKQTKHMQARLSSDAHVDVACACYLDSLPKGVFGSFGVSKRSLLMPGVGH